MVDYNNFAKTFSQSRKNMKWEEIEYFLEKVLFSKESKILDIWCGNWRFLWALKKAFPEIDIHNYTWVDLSTWLLDEAKKLHPDFVEKFSELNMLDLDSIANKFSDIFFIASYHHLNNLEDREEVLIKASKLLQEWWKIYMTNWALNSPLNYDKYKKSLLEISWWWNKWWSLDYNIGIWWNDRYYHCFTVAELEYLALNAWLKIVENRLFDNQRNFITILEK